MPSIQLHFKTNVKSEATFSGIIEQNGSTGYNFSGTIKAKCYLYRGDENFDNTVRLGHGGTSGEYSYLKFILESAGENTFKVEGEGERAANETVDFRLGFNEGISGQFNDGNKITVPAGGPSQPITPVYTTEDSYGNTKYDVRFDGSARADGPNGYVIEGEFSAYSMAGAMTTQYASFGYKTSRGGWEYKIYACDDTPVKFKIYGSRNPGDNIHVQVGATSKVANLCGYGNEISCVLPENF